MRFLKIFLLLGVFLSMSNAQDPPKKKKRKEVMPQKVVVDTTTRSERKADTILMMLKVEQMKLDTLLKEKKK